MLDFSDATESAGRMAHLLGVGDFAFDCAHTVRAI